MADNLNMTFDCPECGKPVSVHAEMDPIKLAPDVRAHIAPVGSAFIYRISSEDIKTFIIDKATTMVPGVKVEVVPCYCEAKRRKKFEPHRSYASLRVAFSEEILDKKDVDSGWFGKIGDTATNIHIVNSLFTGIIQRYQYKKKDIDEWLKNYETLEKIEEAIGVDERFINSLRMYATPQRIPVANSDPWIVFSAAAENVIQDMLTEANTDKPTGRIQIMDTYLVSKGVVEFLVYVYSNEVKLRENPHVRQILLGEEKPKK